MQMGALFPQFEIGEDPAVIKDFAVTAEELGYRYITAFDQIVGLNKASRPDWGYVHDAADMFHEVMILFGFMAAVTERIGFAPGILILPQRVTAVVAKQAAEIDLLSGGRFRLGIGVGAKPDEFEACGVEWRNRGRRTDEQIEVLRLLWTNDLITYEGHYHRIKDGGINPLPKQRPIPIWVGGVSDFAIRRLVKLGDGWMPNFPPNDYGRERVEALHAIAREAGRDPAGIGIEATVTIIDRPLEEVVEEIEGWRALGASHVTLCTIPELWLPEEKRWNKAPLRSLPNPHAHIDAFRRFREAVPELF